MRNLSKTAIAKRNFGNAATPAKRVKAKVEEEPDVEIAWDSVIYRGFFFFGYVICPLVILTGKSDEPKKVANHHH